MKNNKTIQLSTRTTCHDMKYRATQVRKWVSKGIDVTVEVNERNTSTQDLCETLGLFRDMCDSPTLSVNRTSERKLVATFYGLSATRVDEEPLLEVPFARPEFRRNF